MKERVNKEYRSDCIHQIKYTNRNHEMDNLNRPTRWWRWRRKIELGARHKYPCAANVHQNVDCLIKAIVGRKDFADLRCSSHTLAA